jgi:hypothetical protein
MLLQPCTLMEEEEDIVAVSFIGGGNRKTRRKPPICRKSLTNINNLHHVLKMYLHF